MLARGHRGDFSDAQTVHIPIGGAEDRETEGAPGNHLLDEATDIQGIVRLESELTEREIELETLLASQRQLEDRVAMSTLTVEIVPAPPDVFATITREFEPPRPGVLEAASDGWGAFVSGAYAVVLVLATTIPFVLAIAVLAIAALWARGAFSRSATTASRQA